MASVFENKYFELIFNPDGFESYACLLEDPSDEELRTWAEEKWEEFKEGYDYIFDDLD